MLEVVTVWAPRPRNPKWRGDYLALLDLQRRSVERVRHRHVVVTDQPALQGYNTIPAVMQASLMHAILEGQLAYVEQWSGAHPFVLVDIDCIVCRDLAPIFDGKFAVLLTHRKNDISPIQNGAMYFSAGCKEAATAFLRRALELCEAHWGGDQEAISKAVAPVPEWHGLETRFGALFRFEPVDLLNHSPKHAVPNMKGRYIEHFKGEAKRFAGGYLEALFKTELE